VKKTGAELPREPTKQNVISALIQKGVSLDHMTRGELACAVLCCVLICTLCMLWVCCYNATCHNQG
jgi:hypothetical protein